jgi:hypothetical protein
MKKNTLFSIFFFLITLAATAQIDIVSSEFDMQDSTYLTRQVGILVHEPPTRGDFQIWDYTISPFSDPINYYIFYAGTNTGLPNANFFYESAVVLGGMITGARYYYAKNEQFFGLVGREIEGKSFELSALTGNTNDSILISNHVDLFPQPSISYSFPVVANKTWTSTAVSTTPFVIKLPSFGLPYAPATSAYYETRTDSIVGWGILKIRDPQDSSSILEIQVLLNKSTITETDSVFLGGMPAPPTLLMAFGITQGETQSRTVYSFLAKNMYQPALTLNYYGNTDSLILLVADEIPEAAIDLSNSKPIIQSVEHWNIYPNPVKSGHQFSITFDKPNNEDCVFAIYNTAGQQVFMRNINAPQGHFQQNFELNNSTPKGNYFYTLRDQKGNNLAGGVIAVQ